MGMTTTPSFVLEKKLLTSRAAEKELDERMYCVHHIKVQLVKHARRQLFKLQSDKRYRKLLGERASVPAGSKKESDRTGKELAGIRMEYGLTQNQFRLWVQPLQYRYTKRIDSRTAQCIADDIWAAVSKYLFGNGKKLHIPKYEDILSVRSNDNKTGIRFRNDRILWNGLDIQVSRDKKNRYEAEALLCRVKFCKITRKQFSGRWHYYVQLVLEGTPPVKHRPGTGRVGIDPGTGSMAVVSENGCLLEALDDGVRNVFGQLRRLDRAMDRSRRAMNPDNYKPDGTVRKGRKHWRYSRSYRRLQRKRHDLLRRRTASLSCRREALAGRVLEMGSVFFTENMSYSGLQRRSKAASKNAKGRFRSRKRFGRSVSGNAPAMFLKVLDRKLAYSGRTLTKVDTVKFRASQYDHVSDTYIKKHLSRRYNVINGRWVQRDLYSAFLLMNSAESLDHADRRRCLDTYDRFLADHDRCVNAIKDSNKKIPSSFGISKTA